MATNDELMEVVLAMREEQRQTMERIESKFDQVMSTVRGLQSTVEASAVEIKKAAAFSSPVEQAQTSGGQSLFAGLNAKIDALVESLTARKMHFHVDTEETKTSSHALATVPNQFTDVTEPSMQFSAIAERLNVKLIKLIELRKDTDSSETKAELGIQVQKLK